MPRGTKKTDLAKTEISVSRLLGWQDSKGANMSKAKTVEIEVGTISETVYAPVPVMARRLGISADKIKQMVTQGMPARKIGNRIWVLAGDVLARCEEVAN